jgi:RNA recognition motif-containing protein
MKNLLTLFHQFSFGYVEFEDADAAAAAAAEMNGKNVMGRDLKVNFAEPRSNDSGRGGRGDRGSARGGFQSQRAQAQVRSCEAEAALSQV